MIAVFIMAATLIAVIVLMDLRDREPRRLYGGVHADSDRLT